MALRARLVAARSHSSCSNFSWLGLFPTGEPPIRWQNLTAGPGCDRGAI
jgi:hypothetical protein